MELINNINTNNEFYKTDEEIIAEKDVEVYRCWLYGKNNYELIKNDISIILDKEVEKENKRKKLIDLLNVSFENAVNKCVFNEIKRLNKENKMLRLSIIYERNNTRNNIRNNTRNNKRNNNEINENIFEDFLTNNIKVKKRKYNF